MKKIIFGILALSISTAMFAKKPVIEFVENTYDFGTIKEENGKVSHIFEFKNTGDTILDISNVRASCGCTTPQWSRDPIAAGANGSITVTYNASGRPGPFTKAITIRSNAEQKIITIKGYVTPRGRKVEDFYPFLKGDVRLQSQSLNLGEVFNTATKSGKLGIANISNKNITLKFTKIPKYLSIKKNIKLAAGESSNIDVTFDAAKAKDWGVVNSPVEFVSDNNSEKQTFNVSANITEQYTNEQRENAPHIDIDRDFNLGQIELGSKKTVIIKATNSGKSNLVIHKISTENKNVKAKVSKKNIAVGQVFDIKLKIDASKLSLGSGNTSLIIIANDPFLNQKRVNVRYTIVNKTVKK